MISFGAKLIITIVLYILTLATGYWVSYSGKPMNVTLFSLHKLTALVAILSSGVIVVQRLKEVGMTGALVPMLIITVASILLLFITGAILSRGEEASFVILWVHKIVPYVAGTSLGISLYLLINAKG